MERMLFSVASKTKPYRCFFFKNIFLVGIEIAIFLRQESYGRRECNYARLVSRIYSTFETSLEKRKSICSCRIAMKIQLLVVFNLKKTFVVSVHSL